MKKVKWIICLISVLFFVAMAISCQQSVAAGHEKLRGTVHVESDGSGYYILSGGKHYHIDSQQDISAMNNKMANIEGTVTEKDGKLTIAAETITE